jgi:hypothetical protein
MRRLAFARTSHLRDRASLDLPRPFEPPMPRNILKFRPDPFKSMSPVIWRRPFWVKMLFTKKRRPVAHEIIHQMIEAADLFA